MIRIIDADAAALSAWERLEIAYALRLPATYDAHYVAVAERFRVPLWTSDHGLAAALDGDKPKVHLVP